jgi:ABC-type transport system involved in multi-copper enzyme maturation permease subunit
MAVTDPTPQIHGLWQELVTENPMIIEVSRFKRRFLEGGRGKSVNTTILVLAIIAYATLLLVIATMSGDFPPSAIVYLQTATFCILAPALTYASVAGEREKRSWDLLLVAPISHAQIIFGKFIAATAGVFGTLMLFLVPTLFTAFTYKGEWNAYNGSSIGGGVSGTYALVGEEIVSVTFALLLAAMALLFSARCRRSLMALGVVIGALFLGLLAMPMLLMVLTEGTGMADSISFTNPFMAIGRLEELRHDSTGNYYGSGVQDHLLGPWFYGPAQGIFYLLFVAVFLGWAIKTVTFADGDKRFIPRKSNARS